MIRQYRQRQVTPRTVDAFQVTQEMLDGSEWPSSFGKDWLSQTTMAGDYYVQYRQDPSGRWFHVAAPAFDQGFESVGGPNLVAIEGGKSEE